MIMLELSQALQGLEVDIRRSLYDIEAALAVSVYIG